jgi:hypothetical protein
VLVVVAILLEYLDKIISTVDENRDVSEPAALVKMVEKPPRRYLICGWKEADSDDLVGNRIDSSVQPELLAVEANHLLVDRGLIRGHRRGGLYLCFVHPVVDRDVTPIDS